MVGTIQTINENEEPSRRHLNFEFVSELSPEEYNKVTEALTTLNKFLEDSQLFMIVTWNFNEFMELIAYYLHSLLIKDVDTFIQKPINININRVFLNLLSSIRSYLDFMERLLKKRFGEGSVIFNNFKQTCAKEYDNNISYRFLYNLRHYAQHKGFPINSISMGQERSPDHSRGRNYYLHISIPRDEILKDFDWRGLEDEIKSLPEKIDVIQNSAAFMESLNRIHIQVINDLFRTLADSAQQVLLISKRLVGKDGEPMIFVFEGDVKNLRDLHHISLPVKLARHIVDGQLSDIFQHYENNQ